MIESVIFVLQLIAIIVLLGWAVVHDRLADDVRSRGPFAFRQSDALVDYSLRRPRDGGLTRHRRRANLKN